MLTGCAICAIVYLFFHQARLVLQPVPIVFDAPQIAYGYSVNVFSGTVYLDEGTTNAGGGVGVAIHINGSAAGTATTDSNGAYTFNNLNLNAQDVVTVFEDNVANNGVLVAKYNDAEITDNSITGMHIYKNTLILRTSTSDLSITTTNLDTANNANDSDINEVYSLPGNGDLQLASNNKLFVWTGTTHRSSGSIYTHDLKVVGTLNTGSNNVTASGSVTISGTYDTTGYLKLNSVSSGELLVMSGDSANNLYIDNGLEAYFRMDEGTGTTLSSSTLNTQTGGTLENGTIWAQMNTGTTLFYNTKNLEFDGSNDDVDFGDSYDLSTSQKRTFSVWFRRDSATTEDILFAKKTGSGVTAGYILYIDDTTDTLNFQVADGTNHYLVTSRSTVTDQNWHHAAASYDPLNANATNIFLDGSINVSTKAGNLVSGGIISTAVSNAESLLIGASASGYGPLDGALDDFRIYSRAMTGSEITALAAGRKSTGSGTYYLGSNLEVTGDLGIFAGTLDVGNNYAVSVAGDLSLYGLLRTNSGTVTLNGTSQAINGSTAFRNIAKAVTTARTLTFERHTQQTVSGSLSLQGAVNQVLSLRASVSGLQSRLIVEGSGPTTLQYLDVKDNSASSGKLLSCTTGCIDSGNNYHWNFTGSCGDGVRNSGEQCDDGNNNNADACPNDCQYAACGDNVKEGLEECEPPNVGACLSNCLFRTGGGGGGGNGSSAASSESSYFTHPVPPDGCGNGVVDKAGEECDSGEHQNGYGTCSYDCKLLYCGDGVISPQTGEDCEPILKSQEGNVKVFEVALCGETCTAPEVSKTGTTIGGCRKFIRPPCSTSSSSSSSQASITHYQCGDGTIDPGEECDFGGLCTGGSYGGSFWTDKASAAICKSGGGITVPAPEDGCSETCIIEFCGDGLLQPRGADNQPSTADDEACDNGSVCSHDATVACRLDADCGNGNTCAYNEAKDANCSPRCVLSVKNVVKETLPNSDEVNPIPIAQSSSMPNQPMQAYCGNGEIEEQEECDQGDENSNDAADSCRRNCTLPRCGDGILDSGEECDGSLACLSSCILKRQTFAVCGNAITETGEQCDDGNSESNDGCSRFCLEENVVVISAICGNGIVEADENCDDGNQSDDDECTNLCSKPEAKTPKTVPAQFRLDADVVIVNPTEIAIALKFIPETDPCSRMIIKGQEQKAAVIREVALKQKIPIIRDIDLAHKLYEKYQPGDTISGRVPCVEINAMKQQRRDVLKPSAPSPKTDIPVKVLKPEIPSVTTSVPIAQLIQPYAQVLPAVVGKPPVGDTGPGLIGVAVAGVAAGVGWLKRRRHQ